MSNLNESISQFLGRARVTLDNASQTPEIQAALAVFGYDQTVLQTGLELLQTAENLQAVQQREYGEQYAASDALEQARQAANALYSVHRKLAKIALKQSTKQQQALGLNSTRKQSLAGWLGQATIFYTNALADAEVQAALQRFNITPENLAEGQQLVQQVADLNSVQEREKYQAQQATKDRDAALDALNDWLADFKAVALIALANRPQQLEALQLKTVA